MAEKRKVTMTNVFARAGGAIETHIAEDYVELDHLEAYETDARERWQNVEHGEEHDAGPGGDDGEYTIHPHMEGN